MNARSIPRTPQDGRPSDATARSLSRCLSLALRDSARAPVRLAWLVGCALGAPLASQVPDLELELVFEGSRIIDVGHFGDGSDRLLLAATEGRIYVIEDGVLAADPVLDIRDRSECCGEQGFASFAVHPEFPATPEIFVMYTARFGAIGGAPDDVLSRFTWSPAAGRFDASSEVEILRIPQPDPTHNGNDLEFGPDGHLYVSTGDGGGIGDPFQNGQDMTVLNGKILRIDVDGGAPYDVPPDNPHVGDPLVRDEIWASGLRNPWRIGFDRITGDLWIGDSGESRWEEVNQIPGGSPGGQNFGWSEVEGNECFVPGCALQSFTPPAFTYCHFDVAGCPQLGDCSATGARAYRGSRLPELWGWVIAIDFCSGRIRGLRPTGSGLEAQVLLETNELLLTLGEDEGGELYVATAQSQVFRIQPVRGTVATEIPTVSGWARVGLIALLAGVALRRFVRVAP